MKKIKIKRTLRKWHKWTGVIIAIAFGVVGITTFFFAHGKELGFDEVFVNASWLPGYQAYATKREEMEVKCCLNTSEGKWFLGTKSGLFVITGGKVAPVDQLQNMDVRNIIKNRNDLLVATKQGVWMLRGNYWKRIYKGDVHGVTVSNNGEIIIASKKGLRISHDNGKSWVKPIFLNTALSKFELPNIAQKISLQKLIGDLHTGKAFFGKSLEWVWIDVLGLTVIFLTATGVYFWWK
jgi:uncharacterized iron-regulated membrane protein